jgi:hypothetical protein
MEKQFTLIYYPWIYYLWQILRFSVMVLLHVSQRFTNIKDTIHDLI